jgi:putative endonuclease
VPPTDPVWYVYMLRCADGSLYTGVAKDLMRRLDEHNGDGRLGARYTRGRRPVTLVYAEAAPDRSAACRREHAIKRLGRGAKQALAAGWSGRNRPKGPSSAKV